MLAYSDIFSGSFSDCFNLVAASTADFDMSMLLHIVSPDHCYDYRKAQHTSSSGHVSSMLNHAVRFLSLLFLSLLFLSLLFLSFLFLSLLI